MPAKSKKATETKTPWYKAQISFGRVSVVDVVMMAKHLSVMLESGLTVPEALQISRDQAPGTLRKVLKRVVKRVQGGSSFGDAVALEPRVFTPIFVSAIRVGENSGTLSENLSRLAKQMERSLELRRSIQSAMLYPVVVLSAATILGLGIATFVLPQIVSVFASLRVELPWTTRVLLFLAEFFDQYGLIFTPAFIGTMVFLVWFLRRSFFRPFMHRLMLRLPVIGTFAHTINRARFCRTMGTLLESGTPIQEALGVTVNIIPNYVYAQSVKKVYKRVGSGDEFSEILERFPNLYPPVIQRMVSVGERSGNLGSTLMYLAEFYEDRSQNLSKNLSSLLEPILLIVIGLVIGVIAVSILTPIYSITSSVNI